MFELHGSKCAALESRREIFSSRHFLLLDNIVFLHSLKTCLPGLEKSTYTEEINYPIVSLIHPTSNIRTGSQNWVSRVEVVCLYSHVKKVPNGKFIDPNLSLIHSISTSGNKTQNWLPVLNWRRWIVWLFCFWQQKKEWMKEKRKNNSKVSLKVLNFGYFFSSVYRTNFSWHLDRLWWDLPVFEVQCEKLSHSEALPNLADHLRSGGPHGQSWKCSSLAQLHYTKRIDCLIVSIYLYCDSVEKQNTRYALDFKSGCLFINSW